MATCETLTPAVASSVQRLVDTASWGGIAFYGFSAVVRPKPYKDAYRR